MKIVYDARMIFGKIGGIGHFSRNLLASLFEIDSKNDYLIIVRDDINNNLAQNFNQLRFNHYHLSLHTLYFLGPKLSRFRPDIFHSAFHISPLNIDSATIVTAHDIPFFQPDFSQSYEGSVGMFATRYLKSIVKKSFRKARRIVAVSERVRNDIIKLGLASSEKIRVVYPAIRLKIDITNQEIIPCSVNYISRPLILTVGKTRPQKNWWRLIRAFRIFKDKLGQGTLVLVSSDDRNLKSIQALISELKFKPEEISILGYQTQEELVRLYKSADLFVFPSLYEGFGLPPLEAMACGIPVVASNRGSLPEVLGDAAFYVNPESEEDIAAVMQKVLEDSQLKEILIQRGYQQVKKYSWEKAARQILDIYDEVYQETKQ